MRNAFSFKKIVFVLMLMGGCLPAHAQSVKLKPLGQVAIPYNKMFQKTPTGGLSGLTYDNSSDTFYVISDDRSEEAKARFYSFRVELTDGVLRKGGVRFKSMRRLHQANGKAYQKGTVDPEGIALGSDHFMYVSSEGVPEKGIAPFVNAYSTAGRFARALTIPKAFWKNEQAAGRWGVRNNLGFEGLAVTPDGQSLYAATENALIQDGPAADSVHASPSRIIVYDLPTGNIMHEYRYDVNSIYMDSSRIKGFAVNGLSDVLALDNQGHLLTLERNFVLGQGNRICLYEISTEGATDIKEVENMRKYDHPIKPVKKKLVANLEDFDITLDNFEGLALGPKLPGGGQLLLMVSDNNFSRLQQTIFTAFSLGRP